MENHRGRKSIVFPRPPVILAHASVAGKKEAQGPLRDTFDLTSQDTTFGQKSWEKAETQMQKTALRLALEKGKLKETDLDAAFVGDLLNQCISTPVSLPAGLRRATHADGAVDGHRRGRSHSRRRGQRPLSGARDHRHHC